MLEPNWTAVFFDTDILILARRFGAYQAIIAKHELPRESVLQKSD